MKKINFFYLSLLAGALLTLGACNDKDEVTPIEPTPENVGIFVLNEGTYGGTSNLGFYSYGTYQYTNAAYSGNLGAGANDMITYGTKLYISVTDANKIVVLNALTKEELKVIDVSTPRYLLALKGKVYATSSKENKLYAIDTTDSYNMKNVEVGHSPEQLTTTNGKIYVANSGWREKLAGGDYDNHISVVNPSTLTVETNITVADNITTIAADTKTNVLYVNASAIYDGESTEPAVPSKLYIVNTATNTVATSLSFGAEAIAVIPELQQAYLISHNYGDNDGSKGQLLVMNTSSSTSPTVQPFAASSNITNPYSLNFIYEASSLYVGDASDYSSNGKMYIFAYDQYSGGLISASQPIDVGVSPKAFAVSHYQSSEN
ncbi:hypothetical protein GCM10023231_23040 [Olivibacter ginsenosidimutans]|uniref:YncE family protein n=1 Tax=Olivibacter ginsenosidimutans TaxID=1176537 RepID=A0ABP9BH48_9SPHI